MSRVLMPPLAARNPRRRVRLVRVQRPCGLGYPILPDTFNTAQGQAFAFSPNTPDAAVLQALAKYGQTLPPALAAAMATGQASSSYVAPSQAPLISSKNIATGVWLWTRGDGSQFYGDGAGNPVSYTPPSTVQSSAVAPSGQALSTQTGAALRLLQINPIAAGTYQCVMSDGSQHYCDLDGNPISYSPAAASAAAVPASSQAATVTTPAFLGPPVPASGPAPVAVTPAGQAISTTSGTPSTTIPPATGSIVNWLTQSMFGGVPNWLLAGGAALLLLGMGGGETSPRRRRK